MTKTAHLRADCQKQAGVLNLARTAPIAQRIERWPPKPKAQVRVLLGVHSRKTRPDSMEPGLVFSAWFIRFCVASTSRTAIGTVHLPP